MLGEAAHTLEDAERYRQNYQNAIGKIAKIASDYDNVEAAPGISVKLSNSQPFTRAMNMPSARPACSSLSNP